MSNIISADHDAAGDDVVLSNGAMSVFLSVLLLSGSDLAVSDWEVDTVVWLADRDQSVVGLGVVGFDVSELGWSADDHDAQKRFLLRMVDAAIAGHRWTALSYRPAEDVRARLGQFRALIDRYPAGSAAPRGEPWSTRGLRTDRARCPRHDVYLHNLGTDDARCCLLCNDEPA